MAAWLLCDVSHENVSYGFISLSYMSSSTGDTRIDEARRLRVEEGLSGRQIQDRLGVSKTTLQDWLRGIPPPEWTRRPNAKDDLRARAIELRGQGWSVNDIALEIGVARSTAWQWVKHLPLDLDSDRAHTKRQKGRQLTDGRWRAHRACRDAAREAAHGDAAAQVGAVSGRDLLLLGALAYWCEGTKAKPWRPNDEALGFTNSDPALVRLFITFLESVGCPRDVPSYRVAIHESADAAAAMVWWSDQIRLPMERFLRPSLKRHNPSPRRHNTAEDYHGCLIVRVPRSRELYWRIHGVMKAIDASLATGGRTKGSG